MPVFDHAPSEDQLKFLAWAKICLGNKSYSYVYQKNNGKDVKSLGLEISVMHSRIEIIENYLYLSEEERKCLDCEDVARMVRSIKSFCADC